MVRGLALDVGLPLVVYYAVWGAGLLAEALVRVPLIHLLPVPVKVGLSTLFVATFAALISWSVWYVTRAGRRSPS